MQEVATSSQWLFSPKESRAKGDRQLVRVLFPYNSTRVESWILMSKGIIGSNAVDSQRLDEGLLVDDFAAGAAGFSDGLWSAEGIALAMAIHEDVLTTVSPPGNGIPSVRMRDVCQQGSGGNCSASGAPLCAFNTSAVAAARHNLDAILSGGFSPGATAALPAMPVTFPVCLQQEPNHQAAYLPMSAGRPLLEGETLMVGASAMRIDYEVTLDDWTDPISGSGDGPTDAVRSPASMRVQEWELEFIAKMEAWREKLARSSLPAIPLQGTGTSSGGSPSPPAPGPSPRIGVELVYLAGRSLDDGIEASSFTDVPLVATTAMMMCVFATIASGSIDKLVSRQTLVQAGVISAGLAVPLAFGLCALLGIKFVLLNASLPFLAIGLGIDDAFVLQAALSRMPRRWGLRRRMAVTLREAGVAITVTSITDCLAFAVGGLLTQQRGVRNFCLYAVATVACDYALQITFFAACMVLDARREAQGRSAICGGIVAHPLGAGTGPESDDDTAMCPSCLLGCVQTQAGQPTGCLATIPCLEPAMRADGSVVGATAAFRWSRDLQLPCSISCCSSLPPGPSLETSQSYAMLQEDEDETGATAEGTRSTHRNGRKSQDAGEFLTEGRENHHEEGVFLGAGVAVAPSSVESSNTGIALEFPGRSFAPEDRLLLQCFKDTPIVSLDEARKEEHHMLKEQQAGSDGPGGFSRGARGDEVPVLSGACDRACASSLAPCLMRAEVRVAVLVAWVVYLGVFGAAIPYLSENLELAQLAPDDSYVHDFFDAQEHEFGGLQLPIALSAEGTDPRNALGRASVSTSRPAWSQNLDGGSGMGSGGSSVTRLRSSTSMSQRDAAVSSSAFRLDTGFGTDGWPSPSCFRLKTCRDGLGSLAELLGTSLDGNGIGQSWLTWFEGLRLLESLPDDLSQPQFMQLLADLLATDLIGPMLRPSFALAIGPGVCSGALQPLSLHADGTPARDGSRLFVPGIPGRDAFLAATAEALHTLALNQTLLPSKCPCVVSSKVEVRTTPLFSSMDMGGAMVNLRQTLDDGVGDRRAPAGQRASAPARLWFEPFLFFEQFNSVRSSTLQTLLVCAAAMIVVALVLLPSLPVVLLVGVMLISIDVGVLGGMAMWGGDGIDLNSVTAINLCLGLGISLDMVSHPAEGFFQAVGDEWKGPFMLKMHNEPVPEADSDAKLGQAGGASTGMGRHHETGSRIHQDAKGTAPDEVVDNHELASPSLGAGIVSRRHGRDTDAIGSADESPAYLVQVPVDHQSVPNHLQETEVGKPLPCLNAGSGNLFGLGGAVEQALLIPQAWVWGGAEPRARVIVSLVSLGRPVLYGGLSSLLGVALLSGSTSYIFRCFFVCLFLVLSVGLFHALLVIPVLLSLIGGNRPRH